MDESIALCAAKKAELDLLRPLPKEVEQRVLQKLRLDWNYHSNHLEGNSLSYGETKALILHGLTAQGKPLKDHFEITGHNDAILWIEDLIRLETPLTEAVIRQLHALILKEDHYVEARTPEGQSTRLLVEVGKYKSQPNHVLTETGEIVYFSSPVDTPYEMQKLLTWYRETEDDAILRAGIFHYRFIRIHPFSDGNGRVARLIMNFILMMYGYPPVIIKTEAKSEYLSALRMADAGDIPGFIRYIARDLSRSLDFMLSAAKGGAIEDEDDLYKELALLKGKFSSVGTVIEAVRSDEAIREAWERWMRSFFVMFHSEILAAFEAFYLKADTYVFHNGSATSSDFEGQLFNAQQRLQGTTTDLSVSIWFKGLKRIGWDHFTHTCLVRFVFEETRIAITASAGSIFASLGYVTPPTQADLDTWIRDEIRRHMNVLEDWISEQS